MDTLSDLVNLLSPDGMVDKHCRFRGNWESKHDQSTVGVIPYHIVMAGQVRVEVADKQLTLNQGDILLLPHGSPHSLSALKGTGETYPLTRTNNGLLTFIESHGNEVAHEILCGEFIIGSEGMLLVSQSPFYFTVQTASRADCLGLKELIGMLVRESITALPGAKKIIQELSSTLFTLILREILYEPSAVPGLVRLLTDKRLAPAVSAALKEPQLHWTAESLASLCNQSRSSFIRHFAEAYHLPPLEWVTQVRMLKAAKLLKATRYSVGAIAEECGYMSQAAFTRVFKSHFGIPPGQYR